jgi:uncharacterized protein
MITVLQSIVANGNNDAREVSAGIERLEGVQKIWGSKYRLKNVEMHIANKAENSKCMRILEQVSALQVTAAPVVLADYSIDATRSLLVLQYGGEQETMVACSEVDGPHSTLVRVTCRRNIEKLAAAGIYHPYLRGAAHWLASQDTGHLFATDWEIVRLGRPDEIAEMLESVNTKLRLHAPDTRINEVFRGPKVLLPVVHPVSEPAAMASIDIVVKAMCDGIFLINQGMATDEVLQLVKKVRGKYPKLWIGLNLLGMSASEALRKALAVCEGRVDGIWIDDARIDERAGTQDAAQDFLNTRKELNWKGLLFGGVAFKYQRAVAEADLNLAAAVAAPFMDVVCTSGPGTGQAANAHKTTALRLGLPEGHALALASGITENNVRSYLPDVDAFLVGTGIESTFGVLDAKKVQRLQRIVTEWPHSS